MVADLQLTTYDLRLKKIVVLGPESTGKSTLSETLAKELNTVWAPEYARTYIEQLNRDYTEDDLLHIAKGQLDTEDSLSTQANKFLICDTDLNVLKVWAEHKYNRCHSWILEQIAARKYDLYLLTYIDVPWQEDPQREHPSPAMREYFYTIYKNTVIESGVPFIEIKGNPDTRSQQALKAIQELP